MSSIKLIVNHSPNNKIGKDLTELRTVSGTIRGSSSIIDPVVDIVGVSAAEAAKLNYIRIADFGRYYFVKDIEAVRNGVWRLTCHVDVLQSYEQIIKGQQCVIARQEKKYNLLLDDGTLKAYNNPKITTHPFPQGFNTQSFVLVVAGGN